MRIKRGKLHVLKNSKAERFFGLHFYPGVAEYADKDGKRIFLNEDTLRKMDPSFAGRPVYVLHVDDVNANLDELRGEADGWVVRSFYNQADGKHWVEFLVCSEKGRRAVRNGMKLSNAYVPTSYGRGGVWNGVQYAKQVLDAEYEHLAIVPNPRYDESVILTPEQFKQYNDKHMSGLQRVANSKGSEVMLFKREKLKNSNELLSVDVVLPKSGKTITVKNLITMADDLELAKKKRSLATKMHYVVINGEKIPVPELVTRFEALQNEADSEDESDEDDSFENADDEDESDEDDSFENADDEEDEDVENEDDEDMDMDEDEEFDNEDEEDEPKEKPKKENKAKKNKVAPKKNKAAPKKNMAAGCKTKNSRATADELAARRKAKKKADALRNARPEMDFDDEPTVYRTPDERVALGKSRYGSGR